mgnify:CR=1 FL=1
MNFYLYMHTLSYPPLYAYMGYFSLVLELELESALDLGFYLQLSSLLDSHSYDKP